MDFMNIQSIFRGGKSHDSIIDVINDDGLLDDEKVRKVFSHMKFLQELSSGSETKFLDFLQEHIFTALSFYLRPILQKNMEDREKKMITHISKLFPPNTNNSSYDDIKKQLLGKIIKNRPLLRRLFYCLRCLLFDEEIKRFKSGSRDACFHLANDLNPDNISVFTSTEKIVVSKEFREKKLPEHIQKYSEEAITKMLKIETVFKPHTALCSSVPAKIFHEIVDAEIDRICGFCPECFAPYLKDKEIYGSGDEHLRHLGIIFDGLSKSESGKGSGSRRTDSIPPNPLRVRADRANNILVNLALHFPHELGEFLQENADCTHIIARASPVPCVQDLILAMLTGDIYTQSNTSIRMIRDPIQQHIKERELLIRVLCDQGFIIHVFGAFVQCGVSLALPSFSAMLGSIITFMLSSHMTHWGGFDVLGCALMLVTGERRTLLEEKREQIILAVKEEKELESEEEKVEEDAFNGEFQNLHPDLSDEDPNEEEEELDSKEEEEEKDNELTPPEPEEGTSEVTSNEEFPVEGSRVFLPPTTLPSTAPIWFSIDRYNRLHMSHVQNFLKYMGEGLIGLVSRQKTLLLPRQQCIFEWKDTHVGVKKNWVSDRIDECLFDSRKISDAPVLACVSDDGQIEEEEVEEEEAEESVEQEGKEEEGEKGDVDIATASELENDDPTIDVSSVQDPQIAPDEITVDSDAQVDPPVPDGNLHVSMDGLNNETEQNIIRNELLSLTLIQSSCLAILPILRAIICEEQVSEHIDKKDVQDSSDPLHVFHTKPEMFVEHFDASAPSIATSSTPTSSSSSSFNAYDDDDASNDEEPSLPDVGNESDTTLMKLRIPLSSKAYVLRTNDRSHGRCSSEVLLGRYVHDIEKQRKISQMDSVSDLAERISTITVEPEKDKDDVPPLFQKRVRAPFWPYLYEKKEEFEMMKANTKQGWCWNSNGVLTPQEEKFMCLGEGKTDVTTCTICTTESNISASTSSSSHGRPVVIDDEGEGLSRSDDTGV
ncbi:hypothetical protein ADUPG1_011809, partial [Aduncisulcus paluster]